MLGVEVTFETKAVVDAFRALRPALNNELEKAVRATGRAVAREAKRNHAYTDRTGDLTRSIKALPVTGTFTADTLSGGATATTPYAGYVEEGTERMRARPYLSTAYTMELPETVERFQTAVEAAVRRAGF